MPCLKAVAASALGRVGVKHELVFRVMKVNRTVNDEAGGIDVGRAFQHLAVFVDLDQVGRGDFFVKQAKTMHEEAMIGARRTRGNVIPHGIVPAEQLGQAEHRRQVDAHFPLGCARRLRTLGAGEIVC